MGQPQFALEDVFAQFDFVSEAALRETFESAIGAGAFKAL